MNEQIKSYIKTESAISAAFNFFINGMAAALIYHKADIVPTDIVSIAIDLLISCVSICVLTALFSKASVKRTKTLGILETERKAVRFISRLFRRPAVFGVLAGMASAVIIYIPTVLFFVLTGTLSIAFGLYVVLKSLFAALAGGVITALELYAGMCKPKP